MSRLREIKDHFSYCVDNGLTIGEQEEKLLRELYERVKDQPRIIKNCKDQIKVTQELNDDLRKENERYKQAVEEILDDGSNSESTAQICIKALGLLKEESQ